MSKPWFRFQKGAKKTAKNTSVITSANDDGNHHNKDDNNQNNNNNGKSKKIPSQDSKTPNKLKQSSLSRFFASPSANKKRPLENDDDDENGDNDDDKRPPKKRNNGEEIKRKTNEHLAKFQFGSGEEEVVTSDGGGGSEEGKKDGETSFANGERNGKDKEDVINGESKAAVKKGGNWLSGSQATKNGVKENTSKTETKNSKSGAKLGDGAKPKYTPLEQQFVELKKLYPDAILLIECGYKFR